MDRPAKTRFLRTTLVGGVFFILPIVAVIVLLEKALALLDTITAPVARYMALHDVAGIRAARLVGVAFLIAICFVAGLLAKTRQGRSVVGWLEQTILLKVPGYAALKKMGEGVAGLEGANEVVLARIEDAWQISFLIERATDGQVVVFVPGAPNPRSGSVYVMTPDRIRAVDMSMREAIHCLPRLGKGTAALMGG